MSSSLFFFFFWERGGVCHTLQPPWFLFLFLWLVFLKKDRNCLYIILILSSKQKKKNYVTCVTSMCWIILCYDLMKKNNVSSSLSYLYEPFYYRHHSFFFFLKLQPNSIVLFVSYEEYIRKEFRKQETYDHHLLPPPLTPFPPHHLPSIVLNSLSLTTNPLFHK